MKAMFWTGIGIAAAVLAGVASGQAPAAGGGAAAPAPKLRVLLTYGGHGFQEKEFFAMWDALPGVVYERAPLPQSADRLKPGLEKAFDVVAMYDMAATFTPEQQKAAAELFKGGIGLVSLHHNLGAQRDWDGWRQIVGGKYIFKEATYDGKKYVPSTYSHDEDMPIEIADREHPITAGMKDFTIHDETYGGCRVEPGVRVLLRTTHPKNTPEVMWVRENGRSRVVYLQLGHDAKAWANPAFPELLLRSLRWSAPR